jgi:hypothetical protein
MVLSNATQEDATACDRWNIARVGALVDSGWIAVAGAVVGGSLTGVIALLQVRWQHKFDTARRREDRQWSESSATAERQHAEMVLRRTELLELYTRYQLTVDRVENAVRELSDVRRAVQSDGNHLGDDYELKRDAYETAQNEYDKACEMVKLVAPLRTIQVIIQQRQMFNRFTLQAFDGSYDHAASFPAIAEAADLVLKAMRSDLRSLGLGNMD